MLHGYNEFVYHLRLFMPSLLLQVALLLQTGCEKVKSDVFLN